jgi:uncharacterized protein (DUF362 family)
VGDVSCILIDETQIGKRSLVEMDLVIAGIDPVAVDSVGAAVIGIDPQEVKHLRFAEERLGTCDLKRIKILGELLESVRRMFKRSILSGILSHLG